MEKRIGHRSMGKLAAAAAVGLVGYGVSQADAALVIDIRATSVNGVPVINDSNDAPETVVVGAAGHVVEMDVVARVTGTNDQTDEYFKSMMGIFRSSTGGLLGDLVAGHVPDFSSNAPQTGTPLDYDSDGDLDIGTTVNSATPSHFWTVSSGFNPQPDGAAVPGSNPSTEEFVIGTLRFTTGANPTGETFIDFLRRRSANASASNNPAYAAWNEDGLGSDGVRNGLSPYTTDGLNIVVPEPSGMVLAGVAALGLLARRRNNA